jgi:hypothetical protein
LAWSCRVLLIKDEALWQRVDRLIYRLAKNFSIDELQSIIPTYFELGRFTPTEIQPGALFEALERRFNQIKESHIKSGATDERFEDRAMVIQSYFEKYKKIFREI